MARSRMMFICIREDGSVIRVASQSIRQIIDELDDYCNPFVIIIQQDLYYEDERLDEIKPDFVTDWES